MNLSKQAERIHRLNEKWWLDIKTGERLNRNLRELLTLVASELCEAMEGERKDLMDDKIPTRKMAEVEMADTWIRLMDIAGGFDVADLVRLTPGDHIIPDNKGEAIFHIIASAICIDADGDANAQYLNFTLTLIKAYCDKHGYDLFGAVEEKLNYNKTRADHTHEQRKKAHGKKW